MGKYRILYPTVTEGHGIKGAAGAIVEINDELAKGLLVSDAIEEAGQVERTTKAPGEKRVTRIPRKAASK